MNDREREAYLNRIGYEGELRTDKKCLEKIMDLHLCSIPFENLEDIYEKIIVRKRGGYCFELNKLFYELLKALDFRVIPVAVRILWNREELPPVLHRATLVIFEEGSYYCDVGYGGPGPKKPVLMKDGIHREKNGWYRVNMKPGNTNGEILVERRKEEKYLPILRFSQTPTVEADFELLNFYCAKSPDVLITRKRVVSICRPEGSVALTGDVLTIQKAELQKKPVFRIIQINLCEFLDALQTVGQGTSMYKKLTGCLKRIAFMLQIDLECVIQLSIVFSVIILQCIQP